MLCTKHLAISLDYCYIPYPKTWLVNNRLGIRYFPIILGPICAEDFQQYFDYQYVTDQRAVEAAFHRLVNKCLIHRSLQIILGAKGAEDYTERHYKRIS